MSRREVPDPRARRRAAVPTRRSSTTATRTQSTRSQPASTRPRKSTSTARQSRATPEPQRRLRSVDSRQAATRMRIGNYRRRIQIVAVVIIATLGLIGVRVAGLQSSGGDHLREVAREQWTRTVSLPADRGTIFDRNGEELAVSIPASTISINPRLIDDAASTLSVLTSLLNLSVEEQQRLYDDMVQRERGFVYVRRQVDAALGAQIAELRLSGVNVDDEPRRILPGGDTGRSVIGLTDIDGVGIAGLELQYDDMLTGSEGETTREVAPGGRSVPGTEDGTINPVPGDDLVLTLDRSIQFTCEEALIDQVSATGSKAGTCIVMDVDSGELYAMASVRRDQTTGEVGITSGNHAAVDAYEPGSVAKVITIAAGIDTGSVTADTTFVVPWRREHGEDLLRDSHEHPDEEMTVRQILVESSNIGTIDVQLATGRPRHWDYMRDFGLGEKTALGFPGESSGILKHWTALQGSEQVTVSYGQGLASTPIQLVSAVNVIANDGLYVAPKIVRGIVGVDGSITPTAPSATHQAVRPESASIVQDMMVDVVCSGTATRAQVDSFNVAGKTGTGLKAQPDGGYEDEFGQRSYYASFVGFFPAEDPQVTVLISIDEPPAGTINRFGGTAAAPVFARLVPTIANELSLQPPTTESACSQDAS